MKKLYLSLLTCGVVFLLTVSCDKEIVNSNYSTKYDTNRNLVNADDLNFADAKKNYETQFAILRVKDKTKKIPIWEQAQRSTFANGIPLISVPIKVDKPQIKLVKDINGKIEKITLPSPILIAFKNTKTGEYLYKEIQAIPKKEALINKGKGQLKNFKGSITMSTLDGKLESVFDVNNGKFQVAKASNKKNGRGTAQECFTVWNYRSYCGSNNWSMDYEITHHIWTYTGTMQPFPELTPEQQINLPYCEDWEFIGSTDMGCFGEPDPNPEPDPSGGQPPVEPVSEPDLSEGYANLDAFINSSSESNEIISIETISDLGEEIEKRYTWKPRTGGTWYIKSTEKAIINTSVSPNKFVSFTHETLERIGWSLGGQIEVVGASPEINGSEYTKYLNLNYTLKYAIIWKELPFDRNVEYTAEQYFTAN